MFLMALSSPVLLTAQGEATEAPEVLAEVKPSATETIRLLHLGANEQDEHRIMVDVNGKQTPLPAAREALDATGGKGEGWTMPALPAFQLSADGQWVFASQKVCTGYNIGCLYQRGKGGVYKVASKTRFDALAWKFFAEQEEVKVDELLASDSPAHLIDALALSNRYLALRLRGAVFEIPHSKKVPQRAENSVEETGIYDWCCIYDLQQGKFLVTENMEEHNLNSWQRWAGEDSASWETDALDWLEMTEGDLTSRLSGAPLAAFRTEQAAWKKELEQNRADKNFSPLDHIRLRAGQLEIRLLEMSAK
jgi:hypothetical protein